MSPRRILASALATAAVALTCTAPAGAIVGGNDASPGEYPSVAEITFGIFACTGTLIAPDTVLSAGHCGSVTGAVVSTPIAWPTVLINVRIGSITPGSGGDVVPVRSVTVHPKYLLSSGYDISILKLSRPSVMAPTKVAGASETSLWSPGTLDTIVGFGATQEGGDLADTLQEAKVPIVSDADCAKAYSEFDATTMICAGYPQGGVDTCQGDSGGPLFGRTSGGALKVVGATSFGEGCARAGFPGVYARVADTTLREWIRGKAPNGVD